MEFIQSILVHNEGIDPGTVLTQDLPVNPLSHILITLKLHADTVDVTKIPEFVEIAKVLAKIEVLYKGSAVYSMSGLDCLASGIFINNFESWGVNAVDYTAGEWAFTFLVPMTRVLYSPTECFPKTSRGELILQITWGAAWDSFDDTKDVALIQIETVELPDASPTQFIKQTTKVLTTTVTGVYDIELPIGNPISDLVLWATQIPENAGDLPTLDKMEILVDNVNHFYPESFFNTIHNMAGRLRCPPGYWGTHVHQTFTTPVTAGDPVSHVLPENHIIANHIHLPFDIFGNGEYALQTAGKSDVILRVDQATVGVTRCIPVEIVGSAGAV